ncbi:hypothetical protein NDN08_002091 [Rhodosorus marinus]|uniref:Calcium-binding protein n=1 Tax=Rhodosorus marinus TaxID=101924 RepID=A0AAV8USR5_9RHOD|nr:hypothetical protein NDN08_002091 [Rhodosorus marinus]
MAMFIKLSLLAMLVAASYVRAQSTCADFPMPSVAPAKIPRGDTSTVPVAERRVFWARDVYCRDMYDQFNIKLQVCVKNNYDSDTGATTARISFRPTRDGYDIKRVRVGLLEGTVDNAAGLDEFQLDESGDNLQVVYYDYTMSPATLNCCKTVRTLTIVADIVYNGVNRQAIINDSRCGEITGGCFMKVKCLNLFVGTEADDRIFGTKEADLIFGNGGDDYIHSKQGWDFVYGGDGDDVIRAGNGKDYIYGGAGNDQINMGGGTDKAWGESGNDVIKDLSIFGSEYDYVHGGEGWDKAYTFNVNDNRWEAIEDVAEGRPV